MWQDTGAVFRLHLGEDLQFESVGGVGSGQLGGRWNLWGAERLVGCVLSRCLERAVVVHVRWTQPGCMVVGVPCLAVEGSPPPPLQGVLEKPLTT